MKDAKLVAKSQSNQNTIVHLSDHVAIGGQKIVIIGGPCTVESLTQMETVAQHLQFAPVQALRGGVYKPRTSPYAFQGMQGGFKLASEKPDGLDWRDDECNLGEYDNPSDGQA